MEPTCVAFAFKNIEIFNILGGSAGDTNCYMKSMCDEDNLSFNKPGVYIDFKGLVKRGKVFLFRLDMNGSQHKTTTHKLAMFSSFILTK